MDPWKVFILFTLCYLLPETLAGTSTTSTNSPRQSLSQRLGSNRQRRIDPLLIQKYCEEYRNVIQRSKFVKRQSDSSSMSDMDGGDDSSGGDSSSSDSSSSGSSSSMMTTLKGLIKKIPQINFYSSIPNAVGVVGQGFSVLEKISTALGTPLPYYIGSLPVVVFGIALVFIPDLTTLNLPGFYPSGAGEGDPLAAFPPLPNLDGLPDVDLSLNKDNIPPRIIPPAMSSQQSLLSSPEMIDVTSSQMQPLSEVQETDDDSPTNPISFQAPRRRFGEEEGSNIRIHQIPHHQQFQHHNNNYGYTVMSS